MTGRGDFSVMGRRAILELGMAPVGIARAHPQKRDDAGRRRREKTDGMADFCTYPRAWKWESGRVSRYNLADRTQATIDRDYLQEHGSA